MEYAVSVKAMQDMSRGEGVAWIDKILQQSASLPSVAKQQWLSNKEAIKNNGSYLPVALDIKTLTFLAAEMHKGGDVFAKYRVNIQAGKSYVVFDGYAGLRSHLTGTRYIANNAKVVSMGVGKLGAAKAIKGGFIVSVVFSVAFHAIEQLMNDKATWHDFVAGVSVDVVTAVTGGAIAWGAVSAFVGAAAMAAVAPIALVVVAGPATAYFLSKLAADFELTIKIAKMLKESEARMLENLNEIKREVNRGLNYANEDPVGFMHRLFGVPYFGGR